MLPSWLDWLNSAQPWFIGGYAAFLFIGIASAIGGTWKLWRAWFDLGWSAEKAEKNRRDVNWNKARYQQVGTFQVGIPLGIVVMGLMAWHGITFSWLVYLFIGAVWVITAPVRNVLTIAAGIRLLNKVYHQPGAIKCYPSEYPRTLKQAVSVYYKWGLRPADPAVKTEEKRPLFDERLAWANGIFALLRLPNVAVVARVAGYIGLEILGGLIWPIVAFWSVFYAVERIENLHLKPYWASSKARTNPAPLPKSYSGWYAEEERKRMEAERAEWEAKRLAEQADASDGTTNASASDDNASDGTTVEVTTKTEEGYSYDARPA